MIADEMNNLGIMINKYCAESEYKAKQLIADKLSHDLKCSCGGDKFKIYLLDNEDNSKTVIQCKKCLKKYKLPVMEG